MKYINSLANCSISFLSLFTKFSILRFILVKTFSSLTFIDLLSGLLEEVLEVLKESTKKNYIFALFDSLYCQYLTQAFWLSKNTRNEISELLDNEELLKIKMYQKVEKELTESNIGFEDQEILDLYDEFYKEEKYSSKMYASAIKKFD